MALTRLDQGSRWVEGAGSDLGLSLTKSRDAALMGSRAASDLRIRQPRRA
jgi:hypothetical protein